MSPDTTAVIKQSVTMPQVAAHYGYKPNTRGYICCPFHGDKTPSLKVYDGDRGYYCFGCGRGGDALSFVRELTGLPFPDVVKSINDDFRLGLNMDKPSRDELRRLKREREQAETRRAAEKERYNADVRAWCERYRTVYMEISALERQFRFDCFDPDYDDPFSDENTELLRRKDKLLRDLHELDEIEPKRGDYHF